MNPANNAVTADAQARVSQVWTEVLDCPPPSADQHFFDDLGGNSLLAYQATVRLREALGRHVPLKLLFTAPRFADYTAHLSGEAAV
ncbi:phosphopantetheine-binding protein [Streptomyces sp. NBC_00820]|uniref:phosphopantetheine-binding protein n=1 Tax=Streptomyces sp. NBC_00820 TaxID=2975842 RepID=UPI002ED37074|nr:phosphopantetheine-binding protein [Streptomyces sp. NBC_00820]